MEITTFKDSIVQITSGKAHVLALDVKSNVFTWGLNMFGQLAEDPKALEQLSLPQNMKFFFGKSVENVAAGDFTSSATTKANIVYVWGLNELQRIFPSKKVFLFVPEAVQMNISNERFKGEKKGEGGGDSELMDAERFFSETNKLEVSPEIIGMERRLREIAKQQIILTKRLNEEVESCKGNQAQTKDASQLKAEQELLHYAKAAEQNQNTKLAKKKAEWEIARKQINNIKEELKSVTEEIRKQKEDMPNHIGEDEELREMINTLHGLEKSQSERERELKTKEANMQELWRKIERREKLMKSYQNFQINFDKAIAKNPIVANRSDMEKMLDEMGEHFNSIQKTDLLEIRKEMENVRKEGKKKLSGIKELIEISNARLNSLEKIPKDLKFDVSDPQHDSFTKIWEMLMDSITIRKELNKILDTLNEQIAKKIEGLEKPPKFKTLPLERIKNLRNQEFESLICDTKLLLSVPKNTDDYEEPSKEEVEAASAENKGPEKKEENK